jgi:hypothetical protein
MDNVIKTQQELVDEINMIIDRAPFRHCYYRNDPTVKHFAIISNAVPMAEVVASLLEGSPEPKPLQQYVDEGKVTIIESYRDLCKTLLNG